MEMMKDNPCDKIDVGAPFAGFVVAAEVLDHEEDVRYSTCCWSMVMTTQAWTVNSIGKVMVVTSNLMMELTDIDSKLLLMS